MTINQKIRDVISSGILMDDLIVIPERGAADNEIAEEEDRLGRGLSPAHKTLLNEWNGLALEVIRFFGCGRDTGEIGRLSDFRLSPLPDGDAIPVVIGTDASGFIYLEDVDGKIYSIDTKEGRQTLVAHDLTHFVCDVVFGPEAESFAGKSWLEELEEFGLVADKE